jgi:single-strand DNA-binding protein
LKITKDNSNLNYKTMQNWTGHGFVGGDPKVRTTESGKKVASFSFATTSFRKDADGNKISTWHNILVWDKVAETCEKHVKKGTELIVSGGEIQYRTYEDKDGMTKYITEIVCQGIEFCGKKTSEPSNALPDKQGQYQGKKEATASSSPGSSAESLETGELKPDELSDLPFILTIPIALGMMMQFIL